MSWAKLDDHFPTHPKVLAAGGDAAWLHVCALCYCAEHLTDGLVPKVLVGRLSDRKRATALAVRLVEVGMWVDEGDCFRLHDYLVYNPSRERVETEREEARIRRVSFGKTSGERRGSVGQQDADGTTTDMNPVPGPDSLTESYSPAKKSRRNKATAIPEGFELSEETKDWARREYPQHANGAVLAAFKDHAAANDRRQVNWDLAFRNWVRNEAKWNAQKAERGPARTYL